MWYSQRVTKAAEVVHPGEEPFHLPAPTVAAQHSSILSSASALPVRGDQFDVVFIGEFLVERVGVVGFVADEAGGQFVEEAPGENLFHKLALGWRSALHRYGERKTVSSGDSDDLRALAATSGADGEAPLFGAREGGIHERLLQIQLPALMQVPRQSPQRLLQFPAPYPLLESAVAGLEWRIFFGQFTPLRPGA